MARNLKDLGEKPAAIYQQLVANLKTPRHASRKRAWTSLLSSDQQCDASCVLYEGSEICVPFSTAIQRLFKTQKNGILCYNIVIFTSTNFRWKCYVVGNMFSFTAWLFLYIFVSRVASFKKAHQGGIKGAKKTIIGEATKMFYIPWNMLHFTTSKGRLPLNLYTRRPQLVYRTIFVSLIKIDAMPDRKV